MMARMAWGLFVVALATTGCGVGGSDSGGQLGGRTFLSSAVTDHGETRALAPGTRIQLTFDNDKIKADAGCNHLFGPVRVVGERLTVSDLGWTQKGCEAALHEQDDWLTGFLSAGPSWRVDGDQLVLRAGDTEIAFVDRRSAEPDRALVGTRWVVESLVEGRVVSSMPAGVEAYLLFQEGDRVTGSTGCNTVTGTAVRPVDKPDVIVFTGISVTMVACRSASAQRSESAVLSALHGEARVKIDGDRLALTSSDGRGLGLRAGG